MKKRQVKYNRPQNFLLILEDNVHEAGHDNSAKTAGKYMVFGKGRIKDKFLSTGIKFEKSEFVMHAKAHNFEEEKINTIQPQQHIVDKTAPQKRLKNKSKNPPIFNMKSVAKKVNCPGSIINDETDDSEEEESFSEEEFTSDKEHS